MLAALLTYLSWLLGGPVFDLTGLLVVVLLSLCGPLASPRLVMSLYRGRYLAPAEAPLVYRLLEALARRAALEHVPRLYYIPAATLLAFATGRRSESVIPPTEERINRLAALEPGETWPSHLHDSAATPGSHLRDLLTPPLRRRPRDRFWP